MLLLLFLSFVQCFSQRFSGNYNVEQSYDSGDCRYSHLIQVDAVRAVRADGTWKPCVPSVCVSRDFGYGAYYGTITCNTTSLPDPPVGGGLFTQVTYAATDATCSSDPERIWMLRESQCTPINSTVSPASGRSMFIQPGTGCTSFTVYSGPLCTYGNPASTTYSQNITHNCSESKDLRTCGAPVYPYPSFEGNFDVDRIFTDEKCSVASTVYYAASPASPSSSGRSCEQQDGGSFYRSVLTNVPYDELPEGPDPSASYTEVTYPDTDTTCVGKPESIYIYTTGLSDFIPETGPNTNDNIRISSDCLTWSADVGGTVTNTTLDLVSTCDPANQILRLCNTLVLPAREELSFEDIPQRLARFDLQTALSGWLTNSAEPPADFVKFGEPEEVGKNLTWVISLQLPPPDLTEEQETNQAADIKAFFVSRLGANESLVDVQMAKKGSTKRATPRYNYQANVTFIGQSGATKVVLSAALSVLVLFALFI